MGRRTKEVDRPLLERLVRVVEMSGPLSGGLNGLYTELETEYNSTPGIPEPITSSVIGLRVKEWGIETKTKPGKRGRAKGFGDGSGSRNRISKSEKFASNSFIVSHHNELEKVIPKRFLPVLDEVRNGSRRAAVKLNCLQCCGYMTAEVRKCTSQGSCPLWAFRPYQGKIEADEEESTQE